MASVTPCAGLIRRIRVLWWMRKGWTQAEVDDINRRAIAMERRLRGHIDG